MVMSVHLADPEDVRKLSVGRISQELPFFWIMSCELGNGGVTGVGSWLEAGLALAKSIFFPCAVKKLQYLFSWIVN